MFLADNESSADDQEGLVAGGEAVDAIRGLPVVMQLQKFQDAMGRGLMARLEWHEMVGPDVIKEIPKEEQKRQEVIFELIKSEIEYVKDLESIERVYIRPLRNANPPIIPLDRLDAFIKEVFCDFSDIISHHRRMLNRLQEIQREEHPCIRSVIAPVYDAAVNWTKAYTEYISHYPIAAYRIDEELANNTAFKTFYNSTLRDPDSRRLDMKNFIYRPITGLLRYDLLLNAIKDSSPPDHEDLERIPQVLELIKDPGKAAERGVMAARKRVELWNYHNNLVFPPGGAMDMDLLDDTRTVIHTGKLLQHSSRALDWNRWTELFVLLFDNYLVLTKPKEEDGVTKYHVNQRPIPLELLSLASFPEVAQRRSSGLFGHGLSIKDKRDSSNIGDDPHTVYPCNIHHAGRTGGPYQLFAESAQTQQNWRQKLEEAIDLRHIVQDSNKVFELASLSEDTFMVPLTTGLVTPGLTGEQPFTGKVTCSLPFFAADGRGLVAIGCAEGVWIGLGDNPKSQRRVLDLKMVTQCAMLEAFGIFLVLADKSLFACHIEALISNKSTQAPHKLNGTKDVQFFSVGILDGRTFIIYMKKKGRDSVFRALEPIIGKTTEMEKTEGGFGRKVIDGNLSEGFSVYRDFFLPFESFDLVFLKSRIAILCTGGFEVMALSDFKSVKIPQSDDPSLASLLRRCESRRPMGMFRSSEHEFLMCYDEFGLYVDQHGDPSRQNRVVEWEGKAECVAFHPPYVLVFDQQFIEIRHVEKGQLVQIIKGSDIRCIWDGRGSAVLPAIAPGAEGWGDSSSQESRVHAVMKSPNLPPNSKVAVEHVFELVPTMPFHSIQPPDAGPHFQAQS